MSRGFVEFDGLDAGGGMDAGDKFGAIAVALIVLQQELARLLV